MGSKHDPDAVALVMSVSGHCGHCKHRGTARLVAYYSGEVLIRCDNCKRAGEFTPDNNNWQDPNRFKPFRGDRDDPDSGRN